MRSSGKNALETCYRRTDIEWAREACFHPERAAGIVIRNCLTTR